MKSRKVGIDPFFYHKLVIFPVFFLVRVGQVTATVHSFQRQHYLQSFAWAVSFVCMTLACSIISRALPLSLSIHREKAGVIGKEKTWVAFIDSHMYTETSFFRLLKHIATEWQDERHIAG